MKRHENTQKLSIDICHYFSVYDILVIYQLKYHIKVCNCQCKILSCRQPSPEHVREHIPVRMIKTLEIVHRLKQEIPKSANFNMIFNYNEL